MKTASSVGWQAYVNGILGAEISAAIRFYDAVVQWQPRPDDSGRVLAAIDNPCKSVCGRNAPFPDLSAEHDRRTAVLLNGNWNHTFDVQGMLTELRPRLNRGCRVVVVAYNPYLAWLYRLTTRLGLRKGDEPSTFLTRLDVDTLAALSGFESVRIKPAAFCPWRLLGVGTIVNRLMAAIPLLRWLAFATIVILRPIISEQERPSLSIVIPARNERGNIEQTITRLPDLGCDVEVVFVEGHSSDETWEEILRVKQQYESRLKIQAWQQAGKGKNDAVRLGFSKATGRLLTILDADLSMPPEMLGRFYAAYCSGQADFVNGSRLVYPMEGRAMRFLNHLGNIFFAKALSFVLDTRLGDSLCGTKLLAAHDYARAVRWRRWFGDFDPFGDFELLFPAAVMGLGIRDVPVRYMARTYGSTNISRFGHGIALLRMTVIGLLRIKLGQAA